MACDPAVVLATRTSTLRDWGVFALVALLPIVAVALLGVRAARNEQAAVRRQMRLELERAAQQVQGQYDAAVDTLDEVEPPRLGAVSRPSTAPFADAVVVTRDGTLLAPPGAASARDPRPAPPKICGNLVDQLASGTAEARSSHARETFLAKCEEAQSASGRYLWPVVALDPRGEPPVDGARIERWIQRNAALLSDAERAAARLEIARAGWLSPPVRQRLEAALGTTRAADRELTAVVRSHRALLQAAPQAGADRTLRWRDGRSTGVLRPIGDDRFGGFVIHVGSLRRAVASGWPPVATDMQARLVTGPKRPLGPAAQLLSASAYLELEWRGDDALAAKTRHSLLILLVVVGFAVAVALGLAGLLYARMRAERRLSALRTDFVAAVSHELRTPIASLRMLSELLEQDRVEPGERAEIYEALAREARRLGMTVHRLLTFSRMEAGKVRLSREEISLPDLVTETVGTFVERHPDVDVRVAGPESEEDLRAACDGEQLAMAIENLLANALKYAPDGQPYEVSVAEKHHEVHITVADRGPGISRPDQRRIFAPFERAADKLSEATEGSGIGLSLVRHVALAHGGRVWVDSEPGQGAAFTIAIPVPRSGT